MAFIGLSIPIQICQYFKKETHFKGSSSLESLYNEIKFFSFWLLDFFPSLGKSEIMEITLPLMFTFRQQGRENSSEDYQPNSAREKRHSRTTAPTIGLYYLKSQNTHKGNWLDSRNC